jgi:hypothetical protein
MTPSATWIRMLRRFAAAAAVVIATSCAATPPPSQSTPAASLQGQTPAVIPADETPASARDLVDTAHLTAKAEQEGFKAEVRDGDVVYCRKQIDFSERTRIPTRQCLNEDELRALLVKEQQQRDEMHQMRSSPVCPQGGC